MADEPDLQEGATDAGSSGYVSNLQQTLQYYGYYMDGAVDGIFGPITDGAVRQFQQTSGLVVDGWVGPVTWGALTGAASTLPTERFPSQETSRPSCRTTRLLSRGLRHL